MSHFIRNTEQIQSSPLFKTTGKIVVSPKLKNILKSKRFYDNFNPKTTQNDLLAAEEKALDNLCLKLARLQYEKAHKKNTIEMENGFSKLKKKLKTSKNNKNFSVEKVLDSAKNQRKINIRKCTAELPQVVDLLKKHNSKISIQLNVVRQAEQISKMKSSHNQWLNAQNNNSVESPIFKKMTYLLEKARHLNLVNFYDTKNEWNEDYNKGYPQQIRLLGRHSLIQNSRMNVMYTPKRNIDRIVFNKSKQKVRKAITQVSC